MLEHRYILLAAALLTACPESPVWLTSDAAPVPTSTEVDTTGPASTSSTGDTSTSGTPTTTDNLPAPDLSTTTGPAASTATADETSGDPSTTTTLDIEAPPAGVCAPTDEFCWTFDAWCPFYYDKQTCQGVEPACAEWASVCDLCTAARAACEAAWGAGALLCAIGEQKCLASTLLPDCGCQPAVFPCGQKQEDCPANYLHDAGLCRPPCEEDAMSLESEGPISEECGLPDYASCVEGYCLPHVLVFCL